MAVELMVKERYFPELIPSMVRTLDKISKSAPSEAEFVNSATAHTRTDEFDECPGMAKEQFQTIVGLVRDGEVTLEELKNQLGAYFNRPAQKVELPYSKPG